MDQQHGYPNTNSAGCRPNDLTDTLANGIDMASSDTDGLARLLRYGTVEERNWLALQVV